jgi:RNA polymerase sigma factor (sigma-70 family)
VNKSELNKLMLKVQTGDEVDFELLYNETYKGVFSFIYSYTKNYHTSEDLLQDTYIKIRLNAQQYRKDTNVLAWILQIAKNVSLDYLRKQSKQQTCELNEEIVSSQEDITKSLYVHDLLNKYLEDDSRQIVLLHLEYGYKNREIAQILEIPLGTVLWKYNLAMKILKEKLKED